MGFGSVDVVPLTEQLVTNELLNPCYIPSGMSTEPLRFPNFVAGFERNPQHAARTALNIRHTPTDWENSNAALSNEVDSNLQQSKEFLHDTNQLLHTLYKPIIGQTDSGVRLEERITDVKSMRQKSNDELGRLIDEITFLSDAKRNLEKGIQVL